MKANEERKIIPCTIQSGGSIGLHMYETSDVINYVLNGEGKAICNGQEEILTVGICHIRKKILKTVL